MKDIPIIFSGPMVRALLDGRKTMTRRLAWQASRPMPDKGEKKVLISIPGLKRGGDTYSPASTWQKVQPGDRLWVRESLAQHGHFGFPLGPVPQIDDIQGRVWSYMADAMPHRTGGRPSIHMPRWASRLTLIVTSMKVERLHKISNADAILEGCGVNFDHPTPEKTREIFPAERFKDLWIKLHGADSWDDNPEVVALTFIVHKQNIDAMPKADAA